LVAVAVESTLGFEHRLRSVPRRPAAFVEARIEEHGPAAGAIEPWEPHSELVLVCPEVRKRALELLPERDPEAFLSVLREPASPPAAGADTVALAPNLLIAVVGYALWRLIETARSAFVVIAATVAVALLAELVH
jgi:hypothetical protein